MQTYVQLVAHANFTTEGQEGHEGWQRSVDAAGVRANGYGLLYEGGKLVTAELAEADVTVVDSKEATLYNSMGIYSKGLCFFAQPCKVYKHNVTGLYYVLQNREQEVL